MRNKFHVEIPTESDLDALLAACPTLSPYVIDDPAWVGLWAIVEGKNKKQASIVRLFGLTLISISGRGKRLSY
jgi:hypothetical protein